MIYPTEEQLEQFIDDLRSFQHRLASLPAIDPAALQDIGAPERQLIAAQYWEKCTPEAKQMLAAERSEYLKRYAVQHSRHETKH